MNEPPPTRAVLILANGHRAVVETPAPLELIALIGPRYFAGYILQPSQSTIEESRKK